MCVLGAKWKFPLFNESTGRSAFRRFIYCDYIQQEHMRTDQNKKRLVKNRHVWNYSYAPSLEDSLWKTALSLSNNTSTSRCCAPTLLFADKWITKAVVKAVFLSSQGKNWRPLEHSLTKLKWCLYNNCTHEYTQTKNGTKSTLKCPTLLLRTWDFFFNRMFEVLD